MIDPANKTFIVGPSKDLINNETAIFGDGKFTTRKMPHYNAIRTSDPWTAKFGDGMMYIRLQDHTLPVRVDLKSHNLIVDTYYR